MSVSLVRYSVSFPGEILCQFPPAAAATRAVLTRTAGQLGVLASVKCSWVYTIVYSVVGCIL